MPITLQLKLPPKKPAAKPPAPKPKKKEPFLPSEEPASCIGKKHAILVVDDDPVVLKAFELKLTASGFTVTTSGNCATVASTAEQCHAELIVLDINFPPVGGMEWNAFTIAQWIRRFPELARLPVILITAGNAADYQEKAAAIGAAGLFEKPVDFKQLLAAILKALEEPMAAEPTPPAQPSASTESKN